jgi:diadenosine tetraphosphate (Ap4A) HIT family hydrolase
VTTPIHRRVEAARRGESPSLVAKMPSGWLVMADQQVLRGYCLLLPNPVVPHLNALAEPARSRFLADMTRAGDALLELTGAVRINYEMLGNLDPALHAHIIPRYANERDTLKTKPVWFHDWDSAPRFDPGRDGELVKALAAKLGG